VFGFGRKKKERDKKAAEPANPLATYDQVLASLERQAAQVRKSAATLLAARGELKREYEKLESRAESARERLADALGQDNDRAARTLERDAQTAERQLDLVRESLAKAEGDAQLLVEAAEGLGAKVSELKEERQAAKLRMTAGLAVSEALKAEVAELDRVMKLDAARDEVERAHALAQVYKDDAKTRRR